MHLIDDDDDIAGFKRKFRLLVAADAAAVPKYPRLPPRRIREFTRIRTWKVDATGKWPDGGKIAALRPNFRAFPTIFSGNFRI